MGTTENKRSDANYSALWIIGQVLGVTPDALVEVITGAEDKINVPALLAA